MASALASSVYSPSVHSFQSHHSACSDEAARKRRKLFLTNLSSLSASIHSPISMREEEVCL